ncbi:hypothetical protein BDB01DRAFT_284598 [Pilobolus umbonatus]|nr:hypothetical protein BDB01DRAFT_284598 [Pilobolus umbonatus]
MSHNKLSNSYSQQEFWPLLLSNVVCQVRLFASLFISHTMPLIFCSDDSFLLLIIICIACACIIMESNRDIQINQ